jgi:FkbM family methyltransferase
LDIGMNIGWFSLYSRAHGHDVASFEPNPTMFLRMCESLVYNDWSEDDGSVSLWNYGLGSMPGVFNLTLGNNPGGSSFHGERLARKYRRTLPVTVVTLDSIATMRGWLDRNISLAKVDVEGYEDHVIEGGRRLIYNGNVENILMESSMNNITTVGRMLDTLYDAGYRVREILTVNGDPYHEDWWHTFNPALEERRKAGEAAIMSDQLAFLSKVTCNIWWQHKRIAPDDIE